MVKKSSPVLLLPTAKETRDARLLVYRQYRRWALHDRAKLAATRRRLRTIRRDAHAQHITIHGLLAGGHQESTVHIPAHLSFDEARVQILYPEMRKITNTVHRCKRNTRRLRRYESTARMVREIFGDIAEHILVFIFGV